MTRLADVSTGRDNNLNLVRIVAAALVLVSHAWPITRGPGTLEPLERLTGYSLGTIAVLMFFALSGFLIAASFERTPRAVPFLMRRARRLLPGLLVSLVLAAFVMGPAVTTLPLAEYLLHAETWRYVGQNGLMLGLQPVLPGVFADNPYPRVAGSIWTLSYEVMCYLGLLVSGLAGLLDRRRVVATLAVYLVAWLLGPVVMDPLHPRIESLRLLSLPFVIGASFYVWRDRVALSPNMLVALVVATGLTAPTALYPVLFAVLIAYGTLLVGYLPRGRMLAYNRVGDYSYGLYIYAFPVQGLVVALAGPMSPAANIALALPLTLGLAILSWHLVEKPCLRASFGRSAPSRRGKTLAA